MSFNVFGVGTDIDNVEVNISKGLIAIHMNEYVIPNIMICFVLISFDYISIHVWDILCFIVAGSLGTIYSHTIRFCNCAPIDIA